jgi:protein-disulfide isomerase
MLRRLSPFLFALALAGCASNDRAGVARDADAATLKPVAGGDTSSAVLAKADAGRIIGSEKAAVWMIIISDFQCPFCKQWHDEAWEPIRKEYVETGKLRVAYMHLPLSIHPNAEPAAQAAMCAAVQGKFWPVQDALFNTQQAWAKLPDAAPFFEQLAAAAGANVDSLRACVKSNAMRPLLQADEQRVTQAGAQSTPTFFVGSTPLVGAQPLSAFRAAIEAALAAKPAGK